MSYNANWHPARSDNDELFDPIRFRLKINSDAYGVACSTTVVRCYTNSIYIVVNWMCVRITGRVLIVVLRKLKHKNKNFYTLVRDSSGDIS